MVEDCQQQQPDMRLRTVFMITGIGVHDPPESVFTIDWNLCSRSNGIRVHDRPESALRDGRRREVSVRILILHEDEGLRRDETTYPDLPGARCHPESQVFS